MLKETMVYNSSSKIINRGVENMIVALLEPISTNKNDTGL